MQFEIAIFSNLLTRTGSSKHCKVLDKKKTVSVVSKPRDSEELQDIHLLLLVSFNVGTD